MPTKFEQIALEYWYDLVKGFEEEDHNDPRTTAGNNISGSNKYSVELTPGIRARLKQVAGDSAYAELVIYIAGLSVLLYKYNRSHSLISIPNVNASENDHPINFLFVAANGNGRLSFRELIEQVKTGLQQGVKHKEYNYADFLRLIRENGVCDPEIFFQLGISHHRLINVERTGYGPFRLLFYITEQNGEEQIDISFDPDTYTNEFIRQSGAHYLRILSAMLNDPDQHINEFDILLEEENHLLLNVFNNTERPFSSHLTIHELFQQQVERTPDAIALVDGDTTLTYRALNERANRLARYLRSRYEVTSEDLVGIMTDRSPWMIISLLGILKAGAAYVPIDPGYPSERLTFLLEDAGLKLLIVDRNTQLEGVDVREISFQENWPAIYTYSAENLSLPYSPSHLAYVIYTSGSTGKPKGVMLAHAGVVNRIEWMWKNYEFSDQDVILQKTSFVFDVSVWELFMTLCFGAKLVLCKKEIIYDPLQIIACIVNNRITTIHFVPGMLNLFLDAIRDHHIPQLKTIRHIIASGEALQPEMVKKHYRLFDVPLHNLYGPTEAAVDVTSYRTNRDDRLIPIGKPISNIRLYVLDRDMNVVSVGVTGELCIAGVGLAKGYLNRDDLTRTKFVSNPLGSGCLYRTGDLARWLPDGNIEYIGRIDQQVKIRGYRIEPGEIENVMLGYLEMEAVAVIANEEKNGHKYLVAYYQHKTLITDRELREYLAKYLPDYMIPAFYVAVAKFPVTASGKIDRNTLAGYNAVRSDKEEYIAPVNELEELLVGIWQEELKINRIGISSNYFSLGGDSLKAIRLVARINKELGASLDVKDIFKCLTIERLIGVISDPTQEKDNIHTSLRRGLAKIEAFKQFIQAEDVDGALLPPGYEDIYPFTSVEQGMIYASLLRSNEPVYYDQFTYEIVVNDIAAFRDAIRKLVKKHSILRTRYYLRRFSQPAKVVLKEIDLPFVEEDITDLDLQGQQRRVEQYLANDQELRLGFDGDILWHMHIFRLTGSGFFLIWSFHHAVLDGWSAGVFRTELSQVLADEEYARSIPLLKHSYKDYCAINLERKIADEVHQFWRKALDGYSRTKLPFNYSGKRKSDTWGIRKVHTFIDREILEDLEAISREHKVSFKSICLSAYLYLLHLICSENEIVTGVVTHDRPPIEDGDKIVGCFLNVIPVRIDFSKERNSLQLLQEVNDFLISARPNEIPLADIANAIGEKVSGNNLIFDCLLNFIDFHILEEFKDSRALPADSNGEYSLGVPGSEMTNTLFDLEISKTLGDFYAHIKYHPAYFSDNDITWALDLYVRILGHFAKNIANSLEPTDLLTEAELNNLIYGFNDTVRPYSKDKPLHRLFEEQVLKTPGNSALQQNGEIMNYAALNKKANQLAHLLLEKGVKQGDNVGLLADRGFDMITGMYGILKTGAAYVPIDPDYPIDRQQYIIENSGISFIVSDNYYEIGRNFSGVYQIVRIEKEQLELFPGHNPEIRVDGTGLAYIIYTSGSTGKPKGVMIEHHAAVNLVEWVNEEFRVGETDKLLFITSMCFDLSVYDIFGMLATGGSIVIARNNEVRDVIKLIAIVNEQKITFWDSVPSTMNYLVNELEQMPSFTQPHLRLVFMSGDWIPVSLPDRVKKCFPNAAVISLGGATEGTVWSNYYPIGRIDPSWPSIPYGKPIKNNFFYILDQDRRPVVKGATGELYIGGSGVARGYMNNTEKTLSSFVPDPFTDRLGGRMYKTGDLGRMLPDGNMEFLGRIDNQVKIRGYRVEPGEIESHLQKYPGIRESVVAVFKDQNNSNYLCAYIVSDLEFPAHALKEYLGKSLPSYMIPACFMYISSIPVTNNGKINRNALPQPQPFKNEKDAPVAGRSELEIKLLDIVRGLLGQPALGIKDDVFEAGANSLMIGALVNRIHRELEVNLSLGDVFAHPTVALLARHIEDTTASVYNDIPRTAEQDYYELSLSQRRLLMAVQMDKAQNAYNISSAYILKGKLETDMLENAFRELIERHEILRTVFLLKGKAPKQKVLPSPAIRFKIPMIDLRGDPNSQQTVKDLLYEDSGYPFDLEKGPLIRARLFQVGGQEFVFEFTMHHIISDGWSMQIILKEVLTLYNAFINRLPNPLKPLRIQYKDYSEWEHQQLKGDIFRRHELYWLNRFKGELPYLELPADYTRPAVKSFNGDRVTFLMARDEVDKIIELGKKHRVSLFTALLASVNTLLYRYTEQSDIIIGTAVSGRDHIDLENNLGFYVNTLALRTQISPGESFASLLRKVKDIALDAFNHQLYPFDMLIEQLNLPRNVGRLPLFEIMVVLHNTGVDNEAPGELKDITVEDYVVENKTSKYDLLFDFVPIEDGLLVKLEYNTDIFSKDSIERLKAHFLRVWQAVLKNEYQAVSKLDYISASDHQRLAEFNDTDRPYPCTRTIHGLFEEQAEYRSSERAVLFKDKTLTYGMLNAKSNQLAHYLRERYSVQPDDLIGVMLDQSEMNITAILGILKSGGGYLPIDPSYPPGRIQHMLSEARIKVLITDAGYMYSLYPGYDGPLLPLDILEEDISKYPAHNPEHAAEAGHIAYVIYTSGTTGQPKGVIVEHKSVVRLVKGTNYITMGPDSRLLQTGALSFDATTFEIWGMLLNGGELHLLPHAELLHTDLLKKKLIQDGITIMWLTASWCNHIMDTDITVFRKLKYLLTGGEKLSVVHMNKLSRAYPSLQIINGYGPTENTTFSTFHHLNRQYETTVPIGKPIANSKVYILDDQMQFVPIGVQGEICVGGDGLARGYLNKRELTHEKFVETPAGRVYKTGDAGRWLPDGTIEFLGRRDHQVKIRGYRIELDEIKHTLTRHENIDNALVITKEVDSAVMIIAYVVLKEALPADDIKSFLGRHLPEYMIPSHIIEIGNIPLNTNGKADLRALAVMEQDSDTVTYKAPTNETEKKLVKIWQQLFSRNTISIEDDFFILGGHSLKAALMISYVSKEMEADIDLTSIFVNPRLKDLALVIERAGRTIYRDIVKVPEQAHYELSHAQKRVWLSSQLPEESVTFNIINTYRFTGKLNVIAFERAFEEIVKRHESLRTTFISVDGGPRQQVHRFDPSFSTIRYIDLMGSAEKDDKIDKTLKEQGYMPFDLEKGPLLRFILMKISETESVFLFVIHHIISDAWSMEVMVNEIITLYNAFNRQRDSILPPLSIQYKDYAAWQNRQLNEESVELHRKFWNEHLGENIPQLELPTDNPRPANKTYDGDILHFQIDGRVSGRLREISHSNHTSLYVTLLSGIYILLYKHTGQKDVIIGLPSIGRKHKDLENQIGFYSNIIALRITYSPGVSFIGLLQQVRDNILAAQDHDIYPFDRVIEDLELKKEIGRSFLFDVMAHMQGETIREGNEPEGLNNVSISPLEITCVTSKFDLTFSFRNDEHGGSIYGNIIYNTGLFNPRTIERFARDYTALLTIISLDRSLSIWDIKKELLEGAGQPDFGQSILEDINSDY